MDQIGHVKLLLPKKPIKYLKKKFIVKRKTLFDFQHKMQWFKHRLPVLDIVTQKCNFLTQILCLN